MDHRKDPGRVCPVHQSSPGSLWGEDASGRACLCCFPASRARGVCSPIHPRLLFTDYATLWSRRQAGPYSQPPTGRALSTGAEHCGCLARAALPPWIAEDARYVSGGGGGGGAELCTHRAAPAGFPSWDRTLYILDTMQVVRLEGT